MASSSGVISVGSEGPINTVFLLSTFECFVDLDLDAILCCFALICVAFVVESLDNLALLKFVS